MGSAVETLCGQAYGAQKYEMLGVYLQRSAILLTITGVLLTLIYIFCEPILIFLRESTCHSISSSIVHIRSNSPNIRIRIKLPYPKISTSTEYCDTKCIHISCNISITYYTELAFCVQDRAWVVGCIVGVELVLFVYILKSERCKYTWDGFSIQAFSGLPGFFKLSAASAVMLCLETWYFQILVLLAGLLENPELALDALSICTTISGWVFMIAVGFNAAASVRVSNELGAGHPKSAAYSVVVVTSISFIISVIAAIVLLALRNIISYAFTDGEIVANAVSDLCPLLALTLILNGIQPVLSGVAVGCGWQAFVAYVNVGCYYIVGIPLGAVLGFYFNFGNLDGDVRRHTYANHYFNMGHLPN
ncbi:hypothetical protein HYC85_017989 [Camellia sinensis]|uniref:Protein DETOXIFICATION n=1 Tax=Camellia sinensis TaxID=4442 RepID=A0A7J7GT15_CAMSI|nr:hypothetical protein HYC85_017989 [Camellia sinensis]